MASRLKFLNDDNLNNAQKWHKIGKWTAWEKRKWEGVGYSLSVEKKWPWADHFLVKLCLMGMENIIGIIKIQ